jgi:hypothetical protein
MDGSPLPWEEVIGLADRLESCGTSDTYCLFRIFDELGISNRVQLVL